MREVAPGIIVHERDIGVRFVRASGPGGQNVNKVATAAELRFAIDRIEGLSAPGHLRLRALAGRRINAAGEILLQGQRFRTQERNRADVTERLYELIRKAAIAPKARRKSRPPLASKTRRLTDKRHRGTTKRQRSVAREATE